MRPIATLPPATLKNVRFVLTDMDETLTYKGRLAAATYKALEDLQQAGIRVIINTAAPAGWCDQMARMWPVDGVIGENGGLFFSRDAGTDALTRSHWHGPEERQAAQARLAAIAQSVQHQIPHLAYADDQPFRLTSLAFQRTEDPTELGIILDTLRDSGAEVTVNNLWILAWVGAYDKLTMARRVLSQRFGLDIDREGDKVAYVGDSENDAPMFLFFKNSFGVSTVADALDDLIVPPTWITKGPGGDGFVEVAQAIVRHRHPAPSLNIVASSPTV